MNFEKAFFEDSDSDKLLERDFAEFIFDFDSLNNTLISSLDESLFLNDASEVVNSMTFEIREVSARFSSVDDDRLFSYNFLRSSNHSAKSVISLITDRIAVLNDR